MKDDIVKVIVPAVIIAALLAGVLAFAFLFPSEIRKEETSAQKEAQITKKFMDGATLTRSEIAFLKNRDFARLNSAISSVYCDNKGKAYELYRNAIEMGMQSQQAYERLAELYDARNEKIKAIAMYEKAIAIGAPKDAWHVSADVEEVAELYYELGRYDKAASYYERFLYYQPRSVKTKFFLAYCYLHLEKLDEASAQVNKMLELDPSSSHLADIYVLKGLILEKKGFAQEAENSYIEALRVSPMNKDAAAELKRLRAAKGKGQI